MNTINLNNYEGKMVFTTDLYMGHVSPLKIKYL